MQSMEPVFYDFEDAPSQTTEPEHSQWNSSNSRVAGRARPLPQSAMVMTATPQSRSTSATGAAEDELFRIRHELQQERSKRLVAEMQLQRAQQQQQQQQKLNIDEFIRTHMEKVQQYNERKLRVLEREIARLRTALSEAQKAAASAAPAPVTLSPPAQVPSLASPSQRQQQQQQHVQQLFQIGIHANAHAGGTSPSSPQLPVPRDSLPYRFPVLDAPSANGAAADYFESVLARLRAVSVSPMTRLL